MENAQIVSNGSLQAQNCSTIDEKPIKNIDEYEYKITRREHRKKRKIVKFYRETNGNITIACTKASVNRNTYYRFLKSDPAFREAIIDSEASINDKVRDELLAKALKGHSETSIIFYLKKRHPDFQDGPNLLQQFNLQGEMKLDVVLDEANASI